MRLLYLSPLPWGSFAQRPHRFVEWFHARSEGEVLWVDPYPTRLPVWADFRRVKAGRETQKIASPNRSEWLTIFRPRSLPLEPLPGSGILNRIFWRNLLRIIDKFVGKGECLFVIGKPSEFAMELLTRYPDIPSLYDAMDDFPAFYQGLSRLSIRKREREIAERVSRISVSSTALAGRFVSYRSKLTVVLNACSIGSLPPVDGKTTGSGVPVLGYVGTIGRWFDWNLICVLAEANPAMCIRLIGPVHTLPAGRLPENIDLLPACSHSAAIKAMREFSAGLIPFKLTELTASVDPIKYYEYRAIGLPVISTRFGEMSLRDGEPGVYLIDENVTLSSVIDEALNYQFKTQEILQFRKTNSWEGRFDSAGILP